MRGLDRGDTDVVPRNGVPVGELAPLRRHQFLDRWTYSSLHWRSPNRSHCAHERERPTALQGLVVVLET